MQKDASTAKPSTISANGRLWRIRRGASRPAVRGVSKALTLGVTTKKTWRSIPTVFRTLAREPSSRRSGSSDAIFDSPPVSRS